MNINNDIVKSIKLENIIIIVWLYEKMSIMCIISNYFIKFIKIIKCTIVVFVLIL